MALFFLLTLYCSIRAWSGPPWWTAAAAVGLRARHGSKESMVAAPLVVVLWDVIFSSSPAWRQLWTAPWPLYAALAATWIVLALLVAGAPPAGCRRLRLR